jgi:hypothetical protein
VTLACLAAIVTAGSAPSVERHAAPQRAAGPERTASPSPGLATPLEDRKISDFSEE